MHKEEVKVDHRVHSMIIGRRGAGIRKIMSDYNVDIKLPRDGDEDPDMVVVSVNEIHLLPNVDKMQLLTIWHSFFPLAYLRSWPFI